MIATTYAWGLKINGPEQPILLSHTFANRQEAIDHYDSLYEPGMFAKHNRLSVVETVKVQISLTTDKNAGLK